MESPQRSEDLERKARPAGARPNEKARSREKRAGSEEKAKKPRLVKENERYFDLPFF